MEKKRLFLRLRADVATDLRCRGIILHVAVVAAGGGNEVNGTE